MSAGATSAAEAGAYAFLGHYARSGAAFDAVWAAISHKPEFVCQLVRAAYAHALRLETRHAERLAFPEGKLNVRAAMEHLQERGFVLSDGRWVAWLDATAEDHEARAAQQERLALDVLRDAEEHRQAAKAIRDAGVSCLRDLGGAS